MTICQVPVVVSATQGEATVDLVFADGTTRTQSGLVVDRENSARVFARSGEITRIHAHVPEATMAAATPDDCPGTSGAV